MWNLRATSLFCCLATLPLIGCAGGPSTAWQPGTPAPFAKGGDAARVYALGPSAPAAILVVLPGAGAFGDDPALWAAQGFDVVTPSAPELLQLAADREAALARLISSAHALADAPVWLLGGGPAIDAAIASPPLGGGAVSGVVVTSLSSGAATCSRSVTYSYPGNGAKPKVTVETSGNACGPDANAGLANQPPAASPSPPSQPRRPKIIEASARGDAPLPARRAAVEHVAALIKTAPSS